MKTTRVCVVAAKGKKSITLGDSNSQLAKAHVPEGRYQTPPGIQVLSEVQRPEFRLHWGFWV